MAAIHCQKSNDAFQKELEALFRDNRELVLQVAYRRTGNKQDAEDVLQTVFLRLIQRPESQTDFCRNPKGYLYQAAVNEALHIIEARKRQKLTEEDVNWSEIPAPGGDSAHKDDIRRVRAAMARMKPEFARIFNLHYNDGYSCLEIAEILGKPVRTVFVELFRARAELKKAIRIQERQRETQEEKHQRVRGPVFTRTSEA